jgi:tetratricopeptide (TPR) repeat protein
LAELLGTKSYFHAKLSAGLSADLYAEYQRCARMYQPAQLADTLATLVVSVLEERRTPSHFSTLDLHNGLLYRDTSGFYLAFLQRCIEALASHPRASTPAFSRTCLELQVRLANTRRRAGQLDEAEAELSALLLRLRKRPSALLSTLEYELGYVEFLRGRQDAAARLFTQSARTARAGGNPVSEWMSRCVAANARWQGAVSRHRHVQEAPRYVAVLEEAESAFAAHVTSDGNALRWLYNVKHHRFKVAFRTGDSEQARRLARDVVEDPWSKQFDQTGADAIIVGSRVSMINGDYAGGARALSRYAQTLGMLSEGRAEHYLDAGFSAWLSGRRHQARSLWDKGANLPANAGNVPWITLIDEARRLHS